MRKNDKMPIFLSHFDEFAKITKAAERCHPCSHFILYSVICARNKCNNFCMRGRKQLVGKKFWSLFIYFTRWSQCCIC